MEMEEALVFLREFIGEGRINEEEVLVKALGFTEVNNSMLD